MTAGLEGGGGTSAEDDAQDNAGALSAGRAGPGGRPPGCWPTGWRAALVHREPGWKLPRRSALARRFSVSLAEIDVAVEELSRRSLLRKLPDGQLYRASPAEYQIPIEGLAGLSTTVDPMGSSINCQAKHISRRQAPQDICWALGLDPGTQVRVIRCLWTSAGHPVAMSTAYVPQAPGARPADGQQLSAPRLEPDESNWVPAFDEVLSEPPADEGAPEAGIAAGRPAALNVELRPPQPSVARGLHLAPGESAITVTIRFDVAAAPVALTVVMLRPDFFKVSVETTAAPTAAAPTA